MPETAKKITNLRPPEQDFRQNEPSEPWMRQKNEPALWYMRFKRYLDLGPKRSLRKALADEPDTQKATKSAKNQPEGKLSDVSIPGAWKRASKVWRWVERAKSYDLAQVEKDAQIIRNTAARLEFSSRPYRIVQLNYVARVLRHVLESFEKVQLDSMTTYLAIIARYQSVVRDIEREMQSFPMNEDSIDAEAYLELEKELIEYSYKKKLKNVNEREKNALILEKQEKLKKVDKKTGRG